MWKKVDYLLEEQDRVMLKIRNFNKNPILPSETPVSEFLNLSSPETSPTRKRKEVSSAEVVDSLDSAREKDEVIISDIGDTIDIDIEDDTSLRKKSKVSD